MNVDWIQMGLRKVTIVLVVCMAACGGKQDVERTLRPVRFVRVSSGSAGQTRTFSGIVRAGTEARLSFKVAGTMQTLAVHVGSRVDPGELIAALDPTDYLLTQQEALAGLRQAEAQAQSADESYERVKGLYENKNASRGDLEASRAAAESSRQAVNLAAARLEQARLQVQYARLVAPERGAIAEVHAELNENVRPGQTIVVMTSGDQPEVQVAIPEALIGGIQVGDSATVKIDALPGRSFLAVVREVGVTTVGTATTFPVTVGLAASDPGVKPGMAAEVVFSFRQTGRRGGGLMIPSSAVGEDRNGQFVYVLEAGPDQSVVARRLDVSVRAIATEGIEIAGGLEEGMLVATAGVSHLRDGQRVTLLDDSGN